MNPVDVLLILIVLFAIWRSIRRGGIISMLELLSFIGSIIAAFMLYGFVAILFQRFLPFIGVWSAALAFVLIIIIARILFDTLIYRQLQRIPPRIYKHTFNKLSAILPGIVNGILWAALMATFLMLIPLAGPLTRLAQDSRVASKLVAGVSWVQGRLSPVFGDALTVLVPRIKSDEETVKLPYTVKKTVTRPGLEAEMLILVNKERREHGLRELRADTALTRIARLHDADMFARGYFSHISPDGKNPFGRMMAAHIIFRTGGENLALAQTLAIAHAGLMNSPGHRANILNPAFGRLGIGILDGGIYGLMITQSFSD